ncbi:MAG TPA: phosphoribosylglycinamide formyltransferase [Longimicrobiales bacterium]
MTETDGIHVNAAVFASGSGSNFQALLDREGQGATWRTRLVISDREGAGVLDRARAAGIPARVVPVGGRLAEDVETEILAALGDAGVGVIFLAGYLRLVPAGVVGAFPRRILNVHPALLPAFGGKGMYGRHVHEAVLAASARISGPTVHFVDERYDEGSIVAQWPVPVLPGDTPETLAARVLEAEHLLYPLAAEHVSRAVAAGRESGPLTIPGRAFSFVDSLGASALARAWGMIFRNPSG